MVRPAPHVGNKNVGVRPETRRSGGGEGDIVLKSRVTQRYQMNARRVRKTQSAVK